MCINTRRKYKMFKIQAAIPLLVAILFCLFVQAQTGITTKAQEITRSKGGTAVFPCQANKTNHKLEWFFLNHNIQLSSGRSVLINDANKYSLVFPQDHSGKMAINLQIRDLKISDHGYYRCAIHGGSDSVTHKLSVVDAPKPPVNVNTTSANFTDCCRKEGVSEQCMPACNPSTVDRTTFNESIVCATDLNKLLKCFADSRNHITCCRRRFIPEHCLDFCANDPPVLGVQHLTCLKYINQMVSCFEEGQVLLPSVPTKISALNLAGYKLLVSWNPPLENANLVTGYRVSYRQTNDNTGVYSTTSLLTYFTSQYTLTGLEANTRYTIYVIAISKYGSSQPSERIDIPTSNDVSQPGQDKDIKDCCVARKVSVKCRDLLCTTSVLKQWDPTNLASCYPELENIFSCIKGERDHTACCKENNIPTICLGLCGTSPPSFSWDFVECVSDKRLSTIEACVQQGLKYLPSSPQSVHLNSVGSTSADFAWSPPSSVNNTEHTYTYLVQVREKLKGALYVDQDQVTGTYIQLTGLKTDTLYEVRIITIGKDTSSLPSVTISFLTKPELPIYVPPQVTDINNITACCIDAHIDSICIPACTYNVSKLIAFFGNTQNIGMCFSNIQSMIKCASDGRNHTSCCIQRGVTSLCSQLCALSESSPWSNKYLGCLNNVLDIVQCYEEGRLSLPKHPKQVRIIKTTAYTISLIWDHPETGSLVDKYIVRYRNKMQGWKQVDTNSTKTSYILQDLQPSTVYEVNVMSSNSNGTSVPSSTIVIETKGINVTKPPDVDDNVLGKAIFENNTDCCQNYGVLPACMKLCLNQEGATSPCYHDADKIITCGSDGKDHSPCCHRRGVPDVCLSLCKGRSTGHHYVTAFCLTYTVSIQTCFYENDGLIPTPPQNFSLTEIDNQYRRVTWDKSLSNCDAGCTYDVHYWQVSPYLIWYRVYMEDGAVTVKNVSSGWVLSDIKPTKAYRVTVTAHNTYGGSQPAPSQKFYVVAPGILHLTVTRYPLKPAVLESRQLVELHCFAMSQKPAKFYWMFNNKNITGATSKVLSIKSADKKSSGIYTCVGYNDGGSKSVSTYLNVKFKPSVVKFREDNVSPDENRKGLLACWFDGNPDEITWTKNGKIVSAIPGKLYVYVEQREHTGIVVGKLKFANVVSKDFGLYRCNGSNSYGYAIGAVQLINPDKIPTVKPGSKPPNVRACCIKEKVSTHCMPICSFDIDIFKILFDSNMADCIYYLGTFSKCAADHRDHTKCCTDAGVIDTCLPFCNGVVPGGNPYDSTLLVCREHTIATINCIVKGHDNIPSPPRNLFAKIKNKAIDVYWSAPSHNAEKVEKFHVFYNSSKTKAQYHAVSNTIYNYVLEIPDIETYDYFYVWVVATNDFGQSHKSDIKFISLNESSRPTPMPHPHKGDNTLAVGLGVGLTILAIIIITVIIFFVMRMRRGKSTMSRETVTFENPGYGRSQPQVTGLPQDGMQPTGQFAYNKFDENPGYSKCEPPEEEHNYQELESNGSTPATLPVNQEQFK